MSHALPHPKNIGRYQIREILGEGAMGTVYAAWDPKLLREVAIKIVPDHLAGKGRHRERFVREARALAALAHPNITAMYDFSGSDHDPLYVVTERLLGEDLYATLHRRGKMPESIAAAVAHEVCLALEAAHEAGFVHRDVKPENVFLHRGGRVVLTDFGIVKAVRSGTTVGGHRRKTEIIGTPGFMGPEHMRHGELGLSLDLYAVGVLLYNLTTRAMPFAGGSPQSILRAAERGQYDDPRNHTPALSAEFCDVIRNCLRPTPSHRPSSAREVCLALVPILEEAGVHDIRGTLAAYEKNSAASARHARAAAIDVQVQRLRVARAEHDIDAMRRVQQRLFALDPDHPALQGLEGTQGAFGIGTYRLRLQKWAHRAVSSTAVNFRTLCARLQRRRLALPGGWRAYACAMLATSVLAVGFGRHGPALPTAVSQASMAKTLMAGVGPGLIGIHPRQADDYPSGLPALLRAPHPIWPGPYRTAPRLASQALLDVHMPLGLHLRLDGRRLAHCTYCHLRLRPGRHVLQYLGPGRHQVSRTIFAALGEHISLKVDRRHRATLLRHLR